MEIKDIVSKLYLPSGGGGYSESNTVTAAAEAMGGTRARVRFQFEIERAADRVRFDPVAAPGIGQLFGVAWSLRGDSAEQRADFGVGDLRSVARLAHGVELPPDRSGAFAFWAVNGDPQIEFTWPTAFNADGGLVELVVDWAFEAIEPEENDELTRRLLEQIAHDGTGETPAELIEPISETAESLLRCAALETDMTTLKNRLIELADASTDHDHRIALQYDLQRALEARSEQIASLQDNRIAQVHASFDEHLQTLQQTLDTRLDVIDGARQSELQDAKQALRTEIDAVRADLVGSVVALQQQLSQLEQQSPAQVRQRKREQRQQRWRHLRRQVVAFVDLVARFRLIFEPMGDLTLVSGGGTARWKATGSDPRFSVRWRRRGGPTSGWYLLDLHCRCVTGGFADPCFYVDYGNGMREETRIPLMLEAGTARQTCLIRFDRDVVGLRFDPSSHPCEFELGSATLRKLGRAETAVRMAAMGLKPLRNSPAAVRSALHDAWAVLRREGVRGVEQRLRQIGEANTGRFDYDNWVSCYDSLSDADRARAAQMIAAMPRKPKFSIVMPVYNTPEQWLELCIRSVQRQFYTDWEFCIADDASTQPHVRAMLQRHADQDPRIKVCFREKNGHIVHASNSALELVTGDFVVLLDHDDELAPHALFMCALALDAQPHLKLIYSDEDKIDEHGKRFDPYFKPDWNPDLFRSQNMISHLGVYSAELVRKVGGFRPGYEGSQDYDLALRCIEILRADEIRHIPHVLYHWRAIPGSTALASDAKSYARSAGVRALEDHFRRRDIKVEVEETTGGNYRIAYPLPDVLPLVSLIVPTRDKVDLLRVCVDGLLNATDYPNLEVIIANNQSTEAQTLAYFDQLRADPRVRIVDFDAPFNFSGINNFAVAQSRGEIVGLINNDIEVIEPGWLKEMVSHAVRPEIGAVGAMLYFPDDRIQHAGVILGLGGVAGHAYLCKPRNWPGQMNRARVVQNLSCVTAACLLLRKSIYDEVNGLDEGLRVAFNDSDFCIRIRDAGYRNLWTPWAQLYHHESASRGQEDSPEKLARFNSEVDFMRQRWGAAIEQDPAYNPNLSLTIESFVLSWPPRVTYPFRGSRPSGQ